MWVLMTPDALFFYERPICKKKKKVQKELHFKEWLLKIRICTGKLQIMITRHRRRCLFKLNMSARSKPGTRLRLQNKAAKSALKTDIKKFEAAVVEAQLQRGRGALYKVAVKAGRAKALWSRVLLHG